MHLDLARVGRFLDSWPHPSAVVGGLAIVLRVQPRLTRDIDVVVVAPPPCRALLPALVDAGYSYEEEGIDEWLDGGLVRATVPETGEGLDLIVADVPYQEELAARAEPLEIEGVTLPVATLEDLLLLKLEAARPQDLDDALALREAFADRLDRDYLRRWGPTLGVGALRFLGSE